MSDHSHEYFMRRAIELSKRAGIEEKTGGVFGAVIVKDNNIISEGYNQVIKYNDPTWHAEIEAIREACKKIRSPHLKGCIIYTSAEPCPMCLAATMWAHIDHMYYAARVEDALKYGEFDDADFYAEIKKNSQDRIVKMTEILRDDAVKIWQEFAKMPDRARY